MRPFTYERAATNEAAIAAAESSAAYLSGGTTLIDLMKLDVLRPARLTDVRRGLRQDIVVSGGRLSLGAGATMTAAAEHADLRRRAPVLVETLTQAASTQIRNMASLGGNVLQRTRCPYYRDTSWRACNRRDPGSGCAALDAVNRMHAVLGTSESCVATYPGDFAQALMILDAEVELQGPAGTRAISFAELHRLPETAPEVETNLQPADLILGFAADLPDWFRRSRYVKVRDRASYEFALASAAVALDLEGDSVREARIALGGVATVPWRAREAEESLRGKQLDQASAQLAADIAFARARPLADNAFKVTLGRQTLVRALLETASLEA